MKEFSDDLDQDVDNIINQLRNTKKEFKAKQKEEGIENNEQIEEFVIKKASTVVTDCVDMLSSLTEGVKDSFDPNLIESVAELARATSSIMETLARFQHNKKNNETKIEVQRMAIEARKEKEENDSKNLANVGMVLTREEVFKLIQGTVETKKEETKKIEDKTIDI